MLREDGRAWLRRWWRMALEWNIAEQDRGAHGQVKGSRGACATRGAGAGAGAGIYHVIRGGRETEVAFVRRCRRWHEGATATGATCGRTTACTAVVLSPVASAWVVSESLASGDSSSSFLPPAVALTPHEPPAGWIKSVSSLGCRQLLLCRSQASVDLLLDRINTRLTVTQGLGDSCRGPRSSFMRGLCPRNRRPTARLRGRCSGLYWQRSLKHYSTNVAHAKVKSRSGSKGERTNEGSSIESRCAIIRLRNEPSLHSRLGRAEPQLCR